jgi:predicted P-loop ATPase
LIFDDFAKKAFLTHHVGSPMYRFDEPQEISDKIAGDVQKWMQSIGLRTMSPDNVLRGLFNTAREHSFHPVLDYLNGLVWDGVDRNTRWLSTYMGAEDTEYSRMVGPLFLISMAARIFAPGCKVDYMLVFEHKQGKEKSKSVEALFTPWFSDDLPDITANPKDAKLHLRGKWGIEIAEMHAFNRAETNHLKSFITRKEERYRPPFGRTEVDEPRQVLFIGTTNKDTYLKDETGGRRFWPIKCGIIRIDDLIRDRDQMLAQAVVDYHRGLRWWPDPEFEEAHIMPKQAERFEEDDAWADPIRDFLAEKNGDRFSVTDILEVLDYRISPKNFPGSVNDFSGDSRTPINRVGKFEQSRIKAIIANEGCERDGRDGRGRFLYRQRNKSS